MSETMRLLTEAHQTIRTLVGRLDGAESMLAKSDDTAHALQAEVERLTEENANLRKSWAELNDTLIATHEELSRYGVPAADGGAVKRVATLAAQRDEALAAGEDRRIRFSHAMSGSDGKPWSVLEEMADDYRSLKGEVERLKDERDEARELSKRHQEEIRGTWQVLDGGTPVTTGLAGAVLERLKQKDANPDVTVDEVERAASEAGWEASDFRWLAVTVPPAER